jgi:hypothetical protein
MSHVLYSLYQLKGEYSVVKTLAEIELWKRWSIVQLGVLFVPARLSRSINLIASQSGKYGVRRGFEPDVGKTWVISRVKQGLKFCTNVAVTHKE